MSKLKSVEEGWESFKRDVIKDGATPGSLKYARMIFYAGAALVLGQTAVVGELVACQGMSEEDGIRHLDSLSREVDVFTESLPDDAPQRRH